MNHFSNNIRAIRTNLGKTQGEFARLLCISRQKLSHWESGYSSMFLDDVVRVSKELDISIDELVLNKIIYK